MAERLALPTSDHGVAGSNPAGGEILPEPKRRFIAQSLSCSPFHRLEMTEILLKGRKTLSHPSILYDFDLEGDLDCDLEPDDLLFVLRNLDILFALCDLDLERDLDCDLELDDA